MGRSLLTKKRPGVYDRQRNPAGNRKAAYELRRAANKLDRERTQSLHDVFEG
jgi:hypothetical protein